MTIKLRLIVNVIVVLAAMITVGAVAILGTRFIQRNITELTQKSTPYQLKALNQQRAIQAHAANLLSISSSKTIDEYNKTSGNVSDSLAEVNKLSEEMSKLKGGVFSNEDKTISSITKSISEITERKIKAYEKAVAATQLIKAKMNDASKKMNELDTSIRKLQKDTSGTMIKSVDSFIVESQKVNNLNTVKDGLKDLALYISKIPVTNDKRSVATLKDNVSKTIRAINNALKNTSGIDNTANEMIKRIDALNEKITATRGLAFLQLRYISDEDESLKDKIETLAKEGVYEITYLTPTIEREINNANASLKVNSSGMSNNINSFTQTDAILSSASALSQLRASIETHINNCIYSRNVADLNSDLFRINNLFLQINNTAQQLKNLLTKGNHLNELKILNISINAFTTVKQDFLGNDGVSEKIMASIKNTEELERLNGRMKDMVSKQLAESNTEVAKASANQEASVISVNKVSKQTVFMVSIVGILSIVVTLAMGGWIGRAITKPLNKLVKSVQKVENEGDFSMSIDIKSNDEIGRTIKTFNSLMTALNSAIGNINNVMASLAGSDLSSRVIVDTKGDLCKLKDNINTSIERLAGTLSIIRDNAGQVAIACQLTKSAIIRVSDGSQSQLDSIIKLASAINESSASISEVSKNTETASTYSQETSNIVKNGQEKMKQMLQVIEKIAKNSEKINTITDVIKHIADQTNLLSLNASIEAARAGEHGRGFAVVAEEVRKLSDSVATSVAEITELVEQAGKEAKAGVKMSSDLNTEMGKVVEAAIQFDSMLNRISVAMEQQDATLQEINENVNILNTTAESNAAAAVEISTSVEELSKLAEQTKKQVEQFRV